MTERAHRRSATPWRPASCGPGAQPEKKFLAFWKEWTQRLDERRPYLVARAGRLRMNVTVMERIEYWRRYLDDFVPSSRNRHEAHAIHACRLAVAAAAVGTHGVGAILVDGKGDVIVAGRNKVYDGGFRSDLHAEMVVMNDYEAMARSREEARDCTLVASLEPCPMCMARLIVAGVGTVLYVSGDAIGGMVQRRHNLPPTFRAIMRSERQVWKPAECSDELRAAAFHIWSDSREALDQWLPRRQGPSREEGRVAAS